MEDDPPYAGDRSRAGRWSPIETTDIFHVAQESLRTAMMLRENQKSGPTLIEVLIILIVLGLAAVVTIPRFVAGETDTREDALLTSLKTVRNQIRLYHIQHNGTNPTLDSFLNQMTRASNAAGETAPLGTPGYPFGPYLKSIPTNPYTSTDTISTAPRGTSAWHYRPETGEFRANHQ